MACVVAQGDRIAFQVNRAGGGHAEIWIVNGATGTARAIAKHDPDYLDETPTWFPDGRHLAIQSNRTGRMEVWMIAIDGSTQIQITR